jgi:monoamine oxidase
MAELNVDILIVGAGFAGLGAADAISQYNRSGFGPSFTYALIDAAPTPGGRTKTVENDPPLGAVGYLDVGGQYLGRGQSYMMDLVDRFGISTFPTPIPNDKLSVYQAPGNAQLTYFSGNYPLTFNILKALKVIDALTQSTKAMLAEPWNALLAQELDNTTVQQWAVLNCANDPYAQELMQLAIRCAFSVEWDEISMLYLLFYGATAGSFEAFENVTGDDGGDRIRLTYGTASLVRAMLKSFRQDQAYQGVAYDAVVQRIEQSDDGGATVRLRAGETLKAKRVIVAMSPGPSLLIEYAPELPRERRLLAAGMKMGRTIKGFLLYDRPWWRSRYTGYVLSAQGPAAWIMDNTWQNPDTGAIAHPALMTFIAGKFADAAPASKGARHAALVAQVREIFQDDAAGSTIGYVEQDWKSDPFCAGCPAAVPAIGALVDHGRALRTPYGVIHWAGSESGLEWTGGYMNGAVQSGVRAAGEAINALRRAVAQSTTPTAPSPPSGSNAKNAAE